MKILVTVLLTALFVFAVATTWVDVVQPKLAQVSNATPQKLAATTESTPVRNPQRKVQSQIKSRLQAVPVEDSAEKDPEELRQPEPRKGPSLDVTESAALLAQKVDEVKLQESRLVARQEALRMIYDDIRVELSAVDELRKQTNEDLAEAEQRVLDVARRKVPRLTTTRTPPAAPRSAGESQATRSQALFVRKLVDDGKVETAVSVLKSMKARDAAAVLDSLSGLDSGLADKLANSVQSGRDETVRR